MGKKFYSFVKKTNKRISAYKFVLIAINLILGYDPGPEVMDDSDPDSCPHV